MAVCSEQAIRPLVGVVVPNLQIFFPELATRYAKRVGGSSPTAGEEWRGGGGTRAPPWDQPSIKLIEVQGV
eukprot:scaffold92334_cov30-Tisochrysis_lutea.AAC.5